MFQHFVGNFGPTEEHPDPITATLGDPKTPSRRRSLHRNEHPAPSKKRIKLAAEALLELGSTPPSSPKTPEPDSNTSEQETDIFETAHCNVKCDNCGHEFETNFETTKKLLRGNFVKEIKKNDSNCDRYTGVPNVQTLKCIFKWISPCVQSIKLWDGKFKLTSGTKRKQKRKALTLFEEYLMTLVRIRRGYDTRHIAYLFGISTSQVTRVFVTWVNVLSRCLGQTIKWPTSEMVTANMPPSFCDYPKTKAIIDCTEFRVEKPFRPKAQRATWSSYKHANTCKLLVCIMPSGAITFISKVYNGGISDAQIVEKSGLLDLIQPGDDIMADRGFNIRHLLLPKGATLNIPAFSHGKTLGAKAVKRSRNIASVRIHVERAIGRMKSYRILNGTLPLRTRFLLNQITTVVSALSNLHNRLA